MLFQPPCRLASLKAVGCFLDDHIAKDNGIDETLYLGHGLLCEISVNLVSKPASIYRQDFDEVNGGL